MKIFVTGHTGFKGSWLVLLLKSLGHQVAGFSLDPIHGGMFELSNVQQDLDYDFRGNINDFDQIKSALIDFQPDVVFHLAAQPLVRQSYLDPRETFQTNVMGTLNVIEASSLIEKVKAVLVITTDKVYKNVEKEEGYTENDSLGGADPYSASKAMADLLTQSWATSFPGVPTAVLRGGNVIGGGDVSKERLLVDLVESFRKGQSPMLRYPEAVRPLQHVLDCLMGYIRAMDVLVTNGNSLGIWNIGPGKESFVSVRELTKDAIDYWGKPISWDASEEHNPHEAGLLALNSSLAKNQLGWNNFLPYPLCLAWTLDWEKKIDAGENPRNVSLEQINNYKNLLRG